MKMPAKMLFVGLGGAGQRHARIFRSLLPNATFTAYRSRGATPLLRPDFSVDSSTTIEERLDIASFPSLTAALDDAPDLIVVSTPSALHMDAVRAAARRGVGVFVEKPLSNDLDGVAELRADVERRALPFMVSFQRRFHPLIAKARDMVREGRIGKVVAASFSAASYVPDWHPYEDFRALYAVRRDLGGGVLLTEIHEVDLCGWFFGRPDAVFCLGGNFGGVPMDVEDTAHLSLRYADFVVRISLCFMQRKTARGFAVAGTEGHLEWDQEGNVLVHHDYKNGERSTVADPGLTNDDLFAAQARFLLNSFDPAVDSRRYMDAAVESLAIVAAARQSMQSGRAESIRVF